ncbi:hypothetical protein GWI33_023349 [Rhynchophorus ferrugineus]|uniref:PH domain-containing protein n=1 Tax=Rhynchophorus ferrugineus TaxID=354439 RepID=A0A834IMB9_RHYFE|nr:hypothetical protein GWI33_023349 [Rhynchophorus ferrugineus]
MNVSKDIEHHLDMCQNSLQRLMKEQRFYDLFNCTSKWKSDEENSFDEIESYCSYTSDSDEDDSVKWGYDEVFNVKPLDTSTPKNYSDNENIQHNRDVNTEKICRKNLSETFCRTVKKTKFNEKCCEDPSSHSSLLGVDFGSPSPEDLNTDLTLDTELSLTYLDRFDITEKNSTKFTYCYENILLAGYHKYFQKENADAAEQLAIFERILKHAITYLFYCSRHVQDFVGSFVYFQAERLRLLTEKIIFTRSAQQSNLIRENTENNLNADIHLDDIKFWLKKSEDSEIAKTPFVSYYLLVLRNYRTVLATNISKVNNYRFVEFIGPYIFKDVPHDFWITAELFVIEIPLTSASNSRSSSSRMLPSSKLIGQTVIDVYNARTGRFKIVDSDDKLIGMMTSSVEIKIRYPDEIKGVFDVAMGQCMYSAERVENLCVLRKGEILQCVDDDDEDCMFARCILPLNSLTFCCKRDNLLIQEKYLILRFLDGKKEKTIYLFPSDDSDLTIWESRIHLIRDTLRKWNMLEVF